MKKLISGEHTISVKYHQMETFSAAIKMIPHGFDINKYPTPEGSSCFLFCETEEQIDILIKSKYSRNWFAPHVFKHIVEITKKTVDETLIKLISIVTFNINYPVSTFYETEISYGSHVNLIKIAVLLNSAELLGKIMESGAIFCELHDLMFACVFGSDDIIMLMMKYCNGRENTRENGRTALATYMENGQNKQIVQILATKENIFWDNTCACIVNKFGISFLIDLIRDLYTDTKPPHCALILADLIRDLHTDTKKNTPYEIDNLVDVNGNVICKDPAESAIAIFSSEQVLQPDEVHKVFIEPKALAVTDLSGKKTVKTFANGLWIEIPILPTNDSKVRYHLLTVHDKDMIVRFDKMRW